MNEEDLNEEDLNPEEGLDEVIKEQDEDLTKKYKEQQNPQDPNTLENLLKEKEAKGIIDEVMGPDEDDYEGISQYALNRQKLNESRIFQEGRFQEQLDSLPELTIQDISELAIDAKMAMEAAKFTPGGPIIKGGAAAGAVALRRLLPEVNYPKLIDGVFETDFFKNREPITVYALGKKNAGNPNWRPNLKQFGYFPDTKDAVSQFGEQTVADFMERARLHRVGRAKLGKKELMKDFNETLEIVRDDGTIELGMVVRRKKYGNKLDLTDSSNYHVRTLSQVMEDVRVNTGWLVQQSDDVKAMQVVRSKLNQLKTKYSDDLVLAKLMEYADEAYLEHMIGKAQYGWLWDIKEADPTKYPWIRAPERNHVDNLRLLVSNAYKKLKDTTETRIKPLNKLLPKHKRYIINIEDSMNNPFAKDNPLHKSNPGNIIIQTAKPSDKVPKTIGIVGDYLQDFYGPDFIKRYDGNKLLAIFEQMTPDEKDLYKLYKPKTVTTTGKIGGFQKLETAAKYRDRVLKERIELIIKEKGNFTYEEIQKEVFKDLLDFYELFAGKAQFVRRPQYVDDVMERSAKKVVDFPFNYNSHQEFYSQKRKAMQDLAGSIGDYETGRAPRMTKKDYESLWNQITEVGTMNYNFKQDINDFTQRFLRIIGKYE